jgi:nitrite reductase/ring-hydroxylating ferredoxin subunit/uncharacterized membrane protein
VAEPVADRVLKGQKWLDKPAGWTQNVVQGFFKALGPLGRPSKDFLHGQKLLHHPLHPALTDVPLGAWTAGVIADYMAITTNLLPRNAGTVALAIGVVVAYGAAATGYTDFAETYGLEMRTAFVHGLTMSTTITLMTISLVFRLVGDDFLYGPAVGLATAGLFLAGFGMYLGGHVVYRFGSRIDRVAFVEGGPTRSFEAVGAPSDFPEGEMKMVEAKGMAVLMVRLNGHLYGIVNTCSHAGGPLAKGELQGEIVQCPWHGSRFSVVTGECHGGPATFPQPSLDVEEEEGVVRVKLADVLH